MKSHKIGFVMPKNRLRPGIRPRPRLGSSRRFPKTHSRLGKGNHLPWTPWASRYSLPSATQVQCAPPKTIFWIRPCIKTTFDSAVIRRPMTSFPVCSAQCRQMTVCQAGRRSLTNGFRSRSSNTFPVFPGGGKEARSHPRQSAGVRHWRLLMELHTYAHTHTLSLFMQNFFAMLQTPH